MIERNFAEEPRFSANDMRKTYCLYEAPSDDAIRAAAERLGIPADVIIEVDQVRPEQYASPPQS